MGIAARKAQRVNSLCMLISRSMEVYQMGTALLNEFHFSSAQKGYFFCLLRLCHPSAALGSIRPDSWEAVKELRFNEKFG